MTLQVTLEQFPATVERLIGKGPCFLTVRSGHVIATAADPARSILIAASARAPLEEVRSQLAEAKLEVLEGVWSDDFDLSVMGTDESAYVAAVAYASEESKPGLWIDAYPTLPTQVTVLKAMYEEFRDTGEMDEVSFEEFVRHASPNVVIVAPADIQSYLQQKQDDC